MQVEHGVQVVLRLGGERRQVLLFDAATDRSRSIFKPHTAPIEPRYGYQLFEECRLVVFYRAAQIGVGVCSCQGLTQISGGTSQLL